MHLQAGRQLMTFWNFWNVQLKNPWENKTVYMKEVTLILMMSGSNFIALCCCWFYHNCLYDLFGPVQSVLNVRCADAALQDVYMLINDGHLKVKAQLVKSMSCRLYTNNVVLLSRSWLSLNCKKWVPKSRQNIKVKMLLSPSLPYCL